MSQPNARILLLAMSFISISARAGTAGFLIVDATANIFGAGQSVAPAPGGGSGGELPPSFAFSSASGQVLTFSSVTGTASLTPGYSSNADGYLGSSTSVTSYDGISGISFAGRFGFLVGIFLNNSGPTNPAPAVLSYSGADTTTSFSPLLNQTFFIGLGQTDGGITQQFYVPTGATTLYLGFADAYGYNGAPGQYQDNSGSLAVTFNVSGTVPEPSSLILLGTSTLAGIGYLALRRRRAALAA